MLLKRLSIVAVLLTCVVVALGAFTRLQDAGLGCPDWPGCYGHLFMPLSEQSIARANDAFPHRPVEHQKAWPEMVHRYFASTLGLVVLTILFLSVRARRLNPQQPLKLPIALALLVIFQGLLGKWTVTLGLFPTVVMAHLLGGFTTLCLLFLLALRLHFPSPGRPGPVPATLKWGIAGVVILAVQIALGGWTAANYAARICSDLPICQAGWSQHINMEAAFRFWGHGVNDYEFATHLGPDAKITIHVVHRIGAIVTTLYLAGLFAWLWLHPSVNTATRRLAPAAMAVLMVQVGLGVSNVIFDLPLLVAVAHNGVAALLMMFLILLNFSLFRTGSRHS